MKNKIYIGNLPFDINEDSLRKEFDKFGTIDQIKIIKNIDSGKSLGYGFIIYSTPDEAKKALSMGGQFFEKRKLFVKLARDKSFYDNKIQFNSV